MIKSYRDKLTQRFAEGERVREFEGFAKQAEKRLEILEAAKSIQDLRALRSNHFEALKGDRRASLVSELTRNGVFALYGLTATTVPRM